MCARNAASFREEGENGRLLSVTRVCLNGGVVVGGEGITRLIMRRSFGSHERKLSGQVPASAKDLCLATDLEEALPPTTADTLCRAVDTIAHTVVVVKVVLGVEDGGRQGEL